VRQLVLGWVFACLTASFAFADEPANPAMRGVITSQIEAFRVDDFGLAFSYASPNIQNYFQSSERFEAMVRNGYPMVHRPAEVRFLELREFAGALWQKMLIRDQAGVVHILDYQMVKGDEGWLINAVELLQQPETGA